MKTTKTARKRPASKPAKAAPAAAQKEKLEVRIYPSKLETFDASGEILGRVPNGAPGSDAYETNQKRISALHEIYSVTIRKFNAQGVETK